MIPFFVVLSAGWAFLYWIFGGVFFSIVAILWVGRVRRTRFGCLFSLSAIGMGVLAAWSGLRFARPEIRACLPVMNAEIPLVAWQRWIEQFACGIVGLLGAFLIGFLLLLLVGAMLLIVSKSTTTTWVEKQTKNK